jgi:uroporphyrinogen decarboxylase
MEFNMLEWKKSILTSSDRQVMPIMTYPGLSLTGRSIREMVSNGKIQFDCVKAISDKYPSLAASSLIMDLSVEAETFGSKIKFSDNEIPTVSERLIDDFENIKSLSTANFSTGRCAENIRAARLANENIGTHPVFAGTIGPYSLAGRLCDITEFMTGILIDPDGAHALLSTCTDFLIKYIHEFKLAGANGVLIAEPAAGLLSPEQCDEFSSRYVKRIADTLQDETFLIILHNCGNTTNLVDSMVSTGCEGFHFGNAVNMTDILPQVPSDKLVFGNLDPVSVFKNGSPDEIMAKTNDLLLKTAGYKNFVLSSGCDIPPGTPLENIDALFNALEVFNRKE